MLDAGLVDEPLDVTPKEGRGVGVVEAPRGLLFHDYTYAADGKITGANCIIPTGQNVANIEADMRSLAPGLVSVGREVAELALKMLVRAYDPCISCATHSMDVKFIVRP
jgi:coenzyme F420-reducing hydrogenase alpha subunit